MICKRCKSDEVARLYTIGTDHVCGECVKAIADPIIQPMLAERGLKMADVGRRRKTKVAVEARYRLLRALRAASFSSPATALVFGMNHATIIAMEKRDRQKAQAEDIQAEGAKA